MGSSLISIARWTGASLIRCVLSKFIRVKGASIFVVITVIGLILSYIAPYLNGKFLDFLLVNRSERDAVIFALVVASIGVLSALFTYCAGTLSIRISTRLSYDLLRDVILRFEKADYLTSRTTDSAYTTQRTISDSNVVTSFVLTNFINAPLTVAAIPVVLYIIWSIDSTLAVFSVVLLLVYFWVIARLRRALYEATFEKKEADSAFYAVISSQLNQILNIQLTSSYRKSEQRLDAGFDAFFPKVLRLGKFAYSLASIDGLFAALFQAVILIIAGVRIINGGMTIGEYAIIGSYFSVLFKTLKGMVELFKSYQDAKASWDRTAFVLDDDPMALAQSGQERVGDIKRISLSGLEFPVVGPGGAVRELLGGLSFDFSRPGSYCIVGENGRGKTSLLYLMLGLYSSVGKVRYNGTPIEECDLDYLRSKEISCCPQLCYAPDETVRELLLYYGTPFSRHHQHMSGLPSLENSVGELLEKRCTALSGGELRRVYLWSVISRKSSVLVLDEPMTGLDASSRDELAEYVRRNRYGQLIITVSHDKEMIDAVKEVIDLDDMLTRS